MGIKILHTADWHLQGTDLDKILKCLALIISMAIKERPDVIIISGDLTHSRSLQLESNAAIKLFEIISILLDIAPLAVVTGTPSHDGKAALALRSLKGKYPILVSDYPEQFGFFKNEDGGSWDRLDSGFFIPGQIEPDFIVTQIPTPTKQYFIAGMNIEDFDNLISDAMGILFSGYGQHAKIYENSPHIVNGHVSVGGAFISDTQQLIGKDIEVSAGQLGNLNADVICLGHIHKSQQIGDNIFYCGSPDHMKHGEKEDKGFYIHDIRFDILLDDGQGTGDMRVSGINSNFIITPAMKLLEIKEDFTTPFHSTEQLYSADLISYLSGCFMPEDLIDSDLKITLTMWQDEAAAVDPSKIEKSFIDAGCFNCKVFLIRKPRENVRSEKVLAAESLFDKLEAMAELRGEAMPKDIERKTVFLESGDVDPWIADYKHLKGEYERC